MHIGKSLGLKKVLIWSKKDIFIFFIVATIPTATYEIFHFQWLALPWLPMALIGTAVAIIIGFQDNATYDRFWEARKIYGSIVNSSRTWGVLIITYISNDQIKENSINVELELIHRRLIYRHIAWLTALRHQLRQSRGWETNNKKFNIENVEQFIVPEHKISLEEDISLYLSDEDKKYIFSKKNRAMHIIRIQSQDLKNLQAMGLIENFRYIELQRVLSDLYEHQGKCERIKNFPYPRQFSTLNLYFVWIFIVLLPFGMLPEFEKIGHHITWLTIPFCMVVSWIFRTMDKIGESTENPFQSGSNDIPISSISRNIEIDLLEMLDEAELPKPIESTNNILM